MSKSGWEKTSEKVGTSKKCLRGHILAEAASPGAIEVGSINSKPGSGLIIGIYKSVNLVHSYIVAF